MTGPEAEPEAHDRRSPHQRSAAESQYEFVPE